MLALVVISLGLILIGATAQEAPDPFEQIKQALASAACVKLEFISVVESDVFDSVDSTDGSACLAQDGRFAMTIGPDQYINTGSFLYSYATLQNQVTIERVSDGQVLEEISFMVRLDEYFETSVLSAGKKYHLYKRPARSSGLPDSLVVVITDDPARLKRLEYYDANDDFNIIIFEDQQFLPQCDDQAFEPGYPDSVDVVRMY